jgi:hypothetical protein
MVHGRSDRGFDRFQIVPAIVVALLKNNAQQPVYFAGDLALDRFGRFFSCDVCSACSTGRKWQIFRFTSTKPPVKA